MGHEESKSLNKIQRDLFETEMELKVQLELFGQYLAKQEGYEMAEDGIDAIYYYLVQKHHWMPAQVRSLSSAELRWLVREEEQAWLKELHRRSEFAEGAV